MNTSASKQVSNNTKGHFDVFKLNDEGLKREDSVLRSEVLKKAGTTVQCPLIRGVEEGRDHCT